MSTAVLSPCGLYRYRLGRWIGDRRLGTVLFVLANPSTAGVTVNDNTIRRNIGFTRFWGYSMLSVVNPFAYRTKSPKVLMTALAAGVDVVGPDNDRHILAAATEAEMVICGWGTALKTKHPVVKARVEHVVELLHTVHKKLYCIETTKDGQPGHPLMLPGNLQPRLWREAA